MSFGQFRQPLQTTVPLTQDALFAGQAISTLSYSLKSTYAAAEVGLYWGLGAMVDTPNTVKTAATATLAKEFAGFVVRDGYWENAPAGGFGGYQEGTPVTIMQKGVLGVISNAPIAFGAPVLWITADTADPTNVGKITGTASGTQTTMDISAFAKVRTPTTNVDGIATIQVSVNP